MNRFMIAPGARVGACVALDAAEAHHALKVLRVEAGEHVCLSDGAGCLWQAAIEQAAPEGVVARITGALPACESPLRVTVYQGLPKADKLETLAQKLTELGVCALAPVRMARSVVKLDAREGEKKCERLRRIALEAVKQCGRARVMQVERVLGWDEALEQMRAHALFVMPWEAVRAGGLAQIAAQYPSARDMAILIGPEGGIAPEEAAQAIAAGAHAVTLGPRILRTETAALAASALAQLLWGDMG